MNYPHRETPTPRTNPSGKKVWVARVTNPKGKRIIYKPERNGGKGTFKLERDAQKAIDEYYEITYERKILVHDMTLGTYDKTWTKRRPRSKRTNKVNKGRVKNVLDVEIEGRALRDWPYRELARRHAEDLVDHMLTVQGRAVGGAQGILATLSAQAENAITDQIAATNWVKGVRVLANDERCTKPPRRPIVWAFDRMHAFADHAPHPGDPAMIRQFSDTGMRVGEILPLERDDLILGPCPEPGCRAPGTHFHIRRTAHDGKVQPGTKNDHGEAVAGRVVPCPPTLEKMLRGRAVRIDTPLLYPTPTGKLWRERNFLRSVWYPTQRIYGLTQLEREGIDPRPYQDLKAKPAKRDQHLHNELREMLVARRLTPTPHAFRHAYISLLKAEGIDQADLAEVAGHTIETMVGHYTHALGRSFDQIRGVVG